MPSLSALLGFLSHLGEQIVNCIGRVEIDLRSILQDCFTRNDLFRAIAAPIFRAEAAISNDFAPEEVLVRYQLPLHQFFV